MNYIYFENGGELIISLNSGHCLRFLLTFSGMKLFTSRYFGLKTFSYLIPTIRKKITSNKKYEYLSKNSFKLIKI